MQLPSGSMEVCRSPKPVGAMFHFPSSCPVLQPMEIASSHKQQLEACPGPGNPEPFAKPRLELPWESLSQISPSELIEGPPHLSPPRRTTRHLRIFASLSTVGDPLFCVPGQAVQVRQAPETRQRTHRACPHQPKLVRPTSQAQVPAPLRPSSAT
ncbi:hypothetical protein B0T16DRAFT_61873 [Cercophora newfieldiana]|uniref:Uncharacterized protein n=1 Tax=Cercophora newfieldiana TaxID=92897 RepID=A0AA39YRY9_9PEZI|nr:hypothetical protein B0T16DRAFT_61873 [Cercophora newfieldiana]